MLRLRTELTKNVSVQLITACLFLYVSNLQAFYNTFVHSYTHTNSPSKRQDFLAQILLFLTRLVMFRIRNASCPSSSKDRLTKHIIVCTWLFGCVLSESYRHFSTVIFYRHLFYFMKYAEFSTTSHSDSSFCC